MRSAFIVAATALALASVPHVSAAASTDEAIAAKIAAPVLAVARLVAEEKWSPLLDEVVQRAPAAAPLGSRWTPQSPAWQRARKALGARITRGVDAYAKSDDAPRALRTAIVSTLPEEDATAYAAALDGGAGPTIVRYEATTTFVAAVMASSPREPRLGQPGWTERMNSLQKTFNERIGSAVPREDPAHRAAAGRFLGDPVGRKAGQVWMSVVSRAALKIDGAINLMLFDDQKAIERDLAEAVAAVR